MIAALPALTRREADLACALPRRRRLPAILTAPAELGQAVARMPDALVFGVMCKAGPARLLAPAALVREVLAGIDPAAPDAPSDWAALLLELALAPSLDALESVAPALALTLSADPPPETACPYAIGLAIGGRALRLELSETLALAVAGALAALPPCRTPMPALPVRVAARLGWCGVPLGALRNARPGDVILPETAGQGRVYLTAGDTIRWPARHEPGRLAVDGLRSHVNAEQEWWMPDDALPGAEATGLDDLPVRLSFELGQFDLTLAELETLGPGHVFELNRGEADGVDIMANGKRIGAGRAITINGTLGVQIVRLGGS
jgi:type III secretion protein Q